MERSHVCRLYRIPQLLTCLVRNEGTHILNLLCSVGKAYPQAVYFPIRTLYLTLKMEQKEKCERERERELRDKLPLFLYILDKVESNMSQPPFLRSSSQPGTPTATSTADGIEPMQVDSTQQFNKPPEPQQGPLMDAKSKISSTPGPSIPPLPSGGKI